MIRINQYFVLQTKWQEPYALHGKNCNLFLLQLHVPLETGDITTFMASHMYKEYSITNQ